MSQAKPNVVDIFSMSISHQGRRKLESKPSSGSQRCGFKMMAQRRGVLVHAALERLAINIRSHEPRRLPHQLVEHRARRRDNTVLREHELPPVAPITDYRNDASSKKIPDSPDGCAATRSTKLGP